MEPSTKRNSVLSSPSVLTHCAVCRTQNEVPSWSAPTLTGGQAHSFARLADLDFRAAEPVRSTMSAWVTECRGCGFVSETLSTATPNIRTLIQSSMYATLRARTGLPWLAQMFALEAFLLSTPAEIARAYLNAAWSCDDACAFDLAIHMRETCAEYLERAILVHSGLERTSLQLQHIDVLRRVGNFKEAARAARNNLQQSESPASVRAVLSFQSAKSLDGDLNRYTIGEACAGIAHLAPVFFSGTPDTYGESAAQFPRIGR